MELGNYLHLILRGWWIVILTTLAAVAVALTFSFLTTPMYRATASFVVSPNQAVVTSQNLVDSLSTLDKRSIIETYAQVINSNRIYSETASALQLDPSELKNYTHNAVVQTDSNVLVLNVTGPDPQKAATLANSIGQRSINFINGLYQAYDINLLDPAIPPTAPISPQPLRDAGLAAGLGFVIGAFLAILAGRTHPSRPETLPVRRETLAATYTTQYIQRR